MNNDKIVRILYPIIFYILISISVKQVTAQEITGTESIFINDTFNYENDGQILEYKILTLANESSKGTVMVVGMAGDINSSGEIQIPETVTYSGALYSVTQIGDNAFSGCIGLESIILPEDLVTIGNLAFTNCTKLQNVTLPANIVNLSLNSFQGTNIVFWVAMNSNAATYCRQNHYKYNYITDSSTDKIALDYIVIKTDELHPYADILQLYPRKNSLLTVNYYPLNTTERNVTWSSSNTAVAKVDAGGTLTALSSGTATITALVGTKSAKYTVIVRPDTPKSIKAVSAGYDSIRISWDHVRNAQGYRIYRSSSLTGKYTKVADVKTLYYEDSRLSDATTYYYKVSAYSYVGTTYTDGHYSAVTSAKTKVGIPESVIAAYVTDHSIKLSWGRVKGAGGYLVYRASSANGTYNFVKKVSTFYHTDSTLIKSKTYYYKIYAYNYVNKQKVIGGSSKIVRASTILPKYVTFGTLEKTVYKILGHPSSQYYFPETRTYEFYYKKSTISGPLDTATIYLKEVCGEWIVIGWSNLFTGLKVSDGNETNTGTFTLGSSLEDVAKVMETPKYFEIYYGGTTVFGASISTNYIKFRDGSTVTISSDLKVTGWDNKGCLKIKYGADKPTYSQITIGTALPEVLIALGTPKGLTPFEYNSSAPRYLQYGKTVLTFDDNLELAGWKNKGKLNISIGKKEITDSKVKVGSSYNSVVKAMGTPDSYIIDPNHPGTLISMIYEKSIIDFYSNRKVSGIQSR